MVLPLSTHRPRAVHPQARRLAQQSDPSPGTFPPRAAPVITPADQASSGRVKPILIVEDDAAVQMMLSLALEDAEYPVEVASNGAEALQQLDSFQPALVLLDLRMPVMDGPTFLRRLYAEPNRLIPPIIVMTAYHEVDATTAELGLPVISKPMNMKQLFGLIAQYAAGE